MTIAIVLILVLVLLLGLGGAAVVYFVYRRARSTMIPVKPAEVLKPVAPPKPADVQKPVGETPARKPLTFRWRYAALPLAIFVISIILTAVFYSRLPAEVGYRFADGAPDRFASRETVVAIGLVIQLFFALLAVAIAWGITKSRIISQSESTWVDPRKLLWLMGNMVAMPQVILAFAMLDIFSYNSFKVHLIPIWVFALIIMVVGGIVMGALFMTAIWRAWAGGHSSR